MVIDGTEQQMVSHVDKEVSKFTRSGKKSTNTITKLAGVSPNGKLMWFTRSYRGAETDISLCKASTNTPIQLGKDETIAGDKGFCGLADIWTHCEVITPYKKQPGQLKLPPVLKKWNREFKAFRTVVENYFSKIKDFKILQIRFRCKGELQDILGKHHEVWVVCAGLLDEFIMPDGLRS